MTTLHTPEPVKTNKSPWSAAAAAAVAIGAAGLSLTVSAPAQAADCTQWGFPNGSNGFDTGWGSSLPFVATGKSVGPTATGWLGGMKGAGYFSGNVNGSGLSFTWKGDGGPPNFSGGDTVTFTGTVDNDGSAHGTAMNTTTNAITTFTSQKKLVCLDAPPAAANPGPAPVAQGGPVVDKPPTAPTATVTSDVDLYDVPGGSGKVIGQLRKGQVVTLDTTKNTTCPADDWCTFSAPAGSAWGFVTNN